MKTYQVYYEYRVLGYMEMKANSIAEVKEDYIIQTNYGESEEVVGSRIKKITIKK